MKNCIIKLGNGSFYVKHTGDGWLDTTQDQSKAFRMQRKVAEDYLPTLRGNAQYRYLHTNGQTKPFEIIDLSLIDLSIDEEDLKVLFLHTKDAYKGYTFEQWCKEVKGNYVDYVGKRQNHKTFFEWVNGQILAIAY